MKRRRGGVQWGSRFGGAHLPSNPGMIRPPTSPVVGGAAGGGSKGPPATARHPAPSGRVEQAARANGARRVVVADDRGESREGMAYWLRQAGFDVVEASDTTELLEHIANRADVVVLDAQLPGRGGFEIANMLKSDAATATIPIIHVASGFTTGEWRAQGLEAGADAFLTHPVEPQELIATVRALLRIRAAEESVRTAAEQWAATFDAITDAVCLVDAHGDLQRCNDAADTLLGALPGGSGPRKFHDL